MIPVLHGSAPCLLSGMVFASKYYNIYVPRLLLPWRRSQPEAWIKCFLTLMSKTWWKSCWIHSKLTQYIKVNCQITFLYWIISVKQTVCTWLQPLLSYHSPVTVTGHTVQVRYGSTRAVESAHAVIYHSILRCTGTAHVTHSNHTSCHAWPPCSRVSMSKSPTAHTAFGFA